MAHGPRIRRSGWILPGRPWGGGYAAAAAAAAGTTFELLPNTAVTGVANITGDITIDGSDVSPAFVYYGADISGSTWTADTGGANLTLQAGAPTLNHGSPFVGSDDDSPLFDGTAYYTSANTSLGDVAQKSFVIEALIQTPFADGGANGVYASKQNSSGADGWALYHGAAGNIGVINFELNTASGTDSLSSSDYGDGVWHLVHIIADYDTTNTIRLFVNGRAADDNSVLTAATSTNAVGLAIGGYNNGTNPCDGAVAYISFYDCDGLLSDSDNQAFCADRMQRICALYPTTAEGTANWTSFTRATNAYVQNWTGSAFELRQVGPGFPRVEQWRDSASTPFLAYHAEPQIANTLLYSEQFHQSAWTKTACTVGADAVVSPDGTTTADSLIADTNGVALHYVYQIENTSGDSSFSIFVKPGAVDWVFLQTTGSVSSCYFDVANGVVGTAANTITQYIEGPFLNGFYRCTIVYTQVSGNRQHRVAAAEADGDTQFVGDGSTPSIYMWGAMLDANGYRRGHSYIQTIGNTTRNADVLLFAAGDGNIGTDGSQKQGTVYSSVLLPSYAATNDAGLWALSDGGATTDQISARLEADDDKLACQSRKGGGNDGDVTGIGGEITDYTIAETVVAWEDDDLNGKEASSPGTADTSCDMPINLDRLYLGAEADGTPGDCLIAEFKINSTKDAL